MAGAGDKPSWQRRGGSIDVERLAAPVSRVDVWRLLAGQNEINSNLAALITGMRANKDTSALVDELIAKVREQHALTTQLITMQDEGKHG